MHADGPCVYDSPFYLCVGAVGALLVRYTKILTYLIGTDWVGEEGLRVVLLDPCMCDYLPWAKAEMRITGGAFPCQVTDWLRVSMGHSKRDSIPSPLCTVQRLSRVSDGTVARIANQPGVLGQGAPEWLLGRRPPALLPLP